MRHRSEGPFLPPVLIVPTVTWIDGHLCPDGDLCLVRFSRCCAAPDRRRGHFSGHARARARCIISNTAVVLSCQQPVVKVPRDGALPYSPITAAGSLRVRAARTFESASKVLICIWTISWRASNTFWAPSRIWSESCWPPARSAASFCSADARRATDPTAATFLRQHSCDFESPDLSHASPHR